MRAMRWLSGVVAAGLMVGGLAMPVRAEDSNWAQWRGPTFNGASEAKNLPEKLTKEQALWSTPMAGHSNGTAVVFGDKIFTTASAKDSMKLSAVCLSKSDGKILWQKEIGDGYVKNSKNDFATPSPVTDGKSVIFLFGNGQLVSYDMEGKELWKRDLWKDHGKWNVLWVYGSSPLLYKGKLYVQVLHRNVPANGLTAAKPGDSLSDSYLLALDPANGKDLWKVVRPSDAVAESRESYGTPYPWERPAGTQIVLIGGDCITGHDPENGKEIWRAGGWNPDKIPHHRLVPAPVAWEGLVFVCPPKGGKILAWREGGMGDVMATHLAWKSPELTSDVCVPLIYKGKLYVLDGDKRVLSCVEPTTGAKIWSNVVDTGRVVMRGSPTAGDGKIYVTNEDGDVIVCSAEDGKVLSKVSLEAKGTRSSVTLVDGMVIVRTGDKVWAFGKK